MTTLNDVLETTTLEPVATGFLFTEGPLWHPDGFYYFVDLRSNLLLRMAPDGKPEKVRNTDEGNGTTFDLQGRLVNCEGGARRVYRIEHDGTVTTIADSFDGKRLSRPNDVICASDGSLYFTDPNYRVPLEERRSGTAPSTASRRTVRSQKLRRSSTRMGLRCRRMNGRFMSRIRAGCSISLRWNSTGTAT